MPRRLVSWIRGHHLVADSILAVALFGLTVAPLTADRPDCDCTVRWWAYLLAAGATLPVAARRRWPVAVNLAVAPAAVLAGLAALPGPPVPLGAVVAIHAAAAYARRWQARALLAVALVLVPLILLTRDGGNGPDEVVPTLLAIVAAWLLGDATRSRRLLVVESRARAVAQRGQRTAEAALAVAEERARIAREMHDLVGHSMSVMVVVAEGAAGTAESDPAGATRALDTIAATGRRTMSELRSLAGLLRDGAGGVDGAVGDDVDGDDRRPLPGLIDLPALQRTLRDAGVDVTVNAAPHDPPSRPVQLVVYRVVQEALTNALRHAPGQPVDITLYQEDGSLRLRITNPAPAPAPGATNGGHGLRNMRERARSVGGSVVTTAVDGVWTVDLRVPVQQ